MAKVNAARFREALDELKVEVSDVDEIPMVVIDVSPVTRLVGKPFGLEERIVLRLEPSHELIVSRPPGTAVTRTKLWIAGPEKYSWRWGVPKGRSFAPPASNNDTDTQLRAAPITAVLRLAAFKADLWSSCRKPAEEVAAMLWKETWRVLGPVLNSRALAHADRFGLDWSRYRELHQRPDLCDFLDTAPGVGPRFRALPEGMTWESMVVRLLGTSYRDGNGEYKDYGHHPAFLTWVRRVPYSKAIMPAFKVPGTLRYEKPPKDPDWTLMQEVAGAAEEGWLEAEALERLETPLQWLIFHTALVHYRRRQLQQFLADPGAAEAAFVRTFPRLEKSEARWVYNGLDRIQEWEYRVESTARQLAKWAETLGRPELARPSQAERLERLETVCRRLRRMDALEARLELTQYNQADLVAHAPVRVIEQIIAHPDFKWNEKVFETLLHRRGCRRNARIRPFLIERATTRKSLLMLLGEASVAETRALWKRLAAESRELAIEYLEKNGFDPRAGWQVEDLAVLFEEAGEITIRATMLVAELRRAREAGQVEGPTRSRPDTRSGLSR